MQTPPETRLDRIEKGLALLLQGTMELKEAQKKTDAQLNKTDAQILELKEAQKKTDAQLNKTDAQILGLKESQDRTEEYLNRTIEKLDEIGRQLGDLGIVQGQVAEDLFYRNVRYMFKQRNISFGSVRRNVKRKGVGEYDIVAVNSGAVLVIEVKNKLQTRMIDKFIIQRLPKFKKGFPQYKDYKLIGGIGALVVKDDVGRYAEKAGLFVLTQASDGSATLSNRKTFRPKKF